MPEPAGSEPARLEIVAVPGLPEITADDDLARLIVDALARAAVRLRDGDVVVVSSKIVSKAEGRVVPAASREAAVDAETCRVVAERVGPRGVTRVVRSRSGPVLAAAGVDASNVPPGSVLLLPESPDASARALRAGLLAAAGARVGIVVSDTAGRAWRDGQVDLAIGAAGLRVTDDLRGVSDGFGAPLEVTVRALADELAAAADLVKGKLAGVPAAVVRGLAWLVTADDGPGARALLRAPATDWFALGHVEAVRSCLGVPPGADGVPPAPMVLGEARERLTRAVDVALAGGSPVGRLRPPRIALQAEGPDAALATVTSPGGALGMGGSAALGALAQRVLAAAWAEGMTAACHLDDDGRVTVRAQVVDPSRSHPSL